MKVRPFFQITEFLSGLGTKFHVNTREFGKQNRVFPILLTRPPGRIRTVTLIILHDKLRRIKTAALCYKLVNFYNIYIRKIYLVTVITDAGTFVVDTANDAATFVLGDDGVDNIVNVVQGLVTKVLRDSVVQDPDFFLRVWPAPRSVVSGLGPDRIQIRDF